MGGLFLLLVCGALLLIHLVCVVLDRRGLIVYRVRTRSSATSSAISSLQAILQPSVIHIVEAKRHRKLDEANGDPDSEPEPLIWR